MRLSFSTRGWESLSFDELLSVAEEMRFAGIELYNIFKRKDLTEKGAALHEYNITATMRMLRGKDLRIPCLDTCCDISLDGYTDFAKQTLSMAGKMKVRYVAIDAIEGTLEHAQKEIPELLAFAKQEKVILLLKTRGLFSNTEVLRGILDEFADDSLCCLWDMHHTYYYNHESPDTTIRNLGAYVKHVHLRDGDEDGSYTIIGEGTLPIREMMQALSSIDFDGYISLEWKPEYV